ncbi:MAG: hypothetical protein WC374_01450 [Phycisphaerae bacterium]|jgi:hypothetical protein
MKNIAIIILVWCLLLAGCEPEQQQNQREQVSQKIEQAEAEPVKQEQAEPNAPAVQSEQTESQADGQTPQQQAADIKVNVTLLTVDKNDFEALDTLWGYTTGALTVKRRSDIFNESGLKVHMAAGDLSPKFNAFKNSIKSRQEKEISLELADRETGYADLGTGIRNPKFYYLTKWYDADNYQFSSAGRSFKIGIIKVPGRDLLNVQITPVLKNFLNGGGDKEFTELRTALTVKPNQSILIGGSRTSRENLSSALLGLQKEDVDTVLLINVSEM